MSLMGLFTKNVSADAPSLEKVNAAADDLDAEIVSTQNWIAEQMKAFNDGKAARAKRIRESGERAAVALESLTLEVRQ